MPINTKKYQQVILYLCELLGSQIKGKKKLAKLLYYVDFDFFEKNHKSVTGESYRAWPMGPFPVSLDEVTKKMKEDKSLKIEATSERTGYNPTEIYICIKKPKYSILDIKERKMIERVAIKYGHLNGKQLEELTHAEAPYIGTEPKKEIPYELSYYRGTEFNED